MLLLEAAVFSPCLMLMIPAGLLCSWFQSKEAGIIISFQHMKAKPQTYDLPMLCHMLMTKGDAELKYLEDLDIHPKAHRDNDRDFLQWLHRACL